MESLSWWEQHPSTRPPCVTHERDVRTNIWGARLTRHLYGKQTREGRYIFGGDRRVHPQQSRGQYHALPRIVDDMHGSCYEHASSLIPRVSDLAVEAKWSGIMPFSGDGRPLISKAGQALYVCTGLGASGFMRGAMSGILLAQMITSSKSAATLLAEADPQRAAPV